MIRADGVRSLGWIAAVALLFGAVACTSSVRSDGGEPRVATTFTNTSTSTTSTTSSTTTTSLSAAPTPSISPHTTPSTTTSDPGPDRRACGASKVYVIGDSLTKGADFPGGLEQLLTNAGYEARVDAEISRFIKAGVQILDLQAHLRRSRLEPVIMVALGTNDAHAGFTAKALGSLVDQLMTAVGPNRLVVWTTTQFLPEFRSEAFNWVLRAKAVQYPDLLIADWDATDHTGFLAPDGIHYSNDGYRVRAIFTLQQIEAVTRCTPATRT